MCSCRYYYDAETGWYYLQSRYYDPVIHRFINADAFASTGQEFLGYNMYAYCNNTPVSHVDFLGAAPIDIAILFFNHWLSGGGEDLYFDGDTDVAGVFKSSPITQARINTEFQKYINGESYGKEPILYTSSEPDLWLSARNANCVITITESFRYSKGYGILTRETIYSIDVIISDYYNFNSPNDTGDGIGSTLNNMAYYAHVLGIGTDFNWKVHFTCTKIVSKTLRRTNPDLLK